MVKDRSDKKEEKAERRHPRFKAPPGHKVRVALKEAQDGLTAILLDVNQNGGFGLFFQEESDFRLLPLSCFWSLWDIHNKGTIVPITPLNLEAHTCREGVGYRVGCISQNAPICRSAGLGERIRQVPRVMLPNQPMGALCRKNGKGYIGIRIVDISDDYIGVLIDEHTDVKVSLSEISMRGLFGTGWRVLYGGDYYPMEGVVTLRRDRFLLIRSLGMVKKLARTLLHKG